MDELPLDVLGSTGNGGSPLFAREPELIVRRSKQLTINSELKRTRGIRLFNKNIAL